MKKWTLTQVIAAAFWFNGQQTVKKTAEERGISEEDVQNIRKSDEYRENVKALMLATRSSENIKKWIENYPRSEMPKAFGKRMGLEPHVVERLIEEVLSHLSSE